MAELKQAQKSEPVDLVEMMAGHNNDMETVEPEQAQNQPGSSESDA
jgi:hypothetical protein